MSIPNKPTLVAAALYGICSPYKTDTRKGPAPATWCELSPKQRKPFQDATEYLFAQTHGVAMQSVDRPKLAASIEAQKIPGIDANANLIISVFVNLSSTLP